MQVYCVYAKGDNTQRKFFRMMRFKTTQRNANSTRQSGSE